VQRRGWAGAFSFHLVGLVVGDDIGGDLDGGTGGDVDAVGDCV